MFNGRLLTFRIDPIYRRNSPIVSASADVLHRRLVVEGEGKAFKRTRTSQGKLKSSRQTQEFEECGVEHAERQTLGG